MIELRHLRKEYETVTPLEDVNVTVNDGDVIAVIGPSGTGKSTLLRCINMLEKPTSGEIFVNGTCITAKKCALNEVRKKMGMVFQGFYLFPHLTVIENVMKPPMELLGMSKQDAYDQAMVLLRTVGMENRALEYPDMLSGGQKQRVAIARTLSMDPDVILFDEPTSALDPTMVGEVQAVIRELAKTGKTMLIVTHEMKFAREISNRVFYMDAGGIYEDGTPEQVFGHPVGELTRRFIRRLKVFEAKIDDRVHDLPGTVSEIGQYGYRNQLPPKTVYRITAAFEELCEQILLPVLPDPHICFTAEYEEETAKATVIVSYSGERCNRLTGADPLAVALLNNQAEEIAYRETGDETYPNEITLKIR